MNGEDYSKQYLYKRIVAAKKHIDSNYMKSVNLDKLLDVANFSKFHFIRLFKKSYGKTPHQYLTFQRIERAKILLLKPKKEIGSIAIEVGFQDQSSFSKLFKSLVGCSPVQFRNTQIRKQNLSLEKPLSQIPGCYSIANKLI